MIEAPEAPEPPQSMEIGIGTVRIEDGRKIIFNPNDQIKNELSKKGDHREYVSKVLRSVVNYMSAEAFFQKGQEVEITMEIK